MKRFSEKERQAYRKEIEQKAVDLVSSYQLLRDQPVANRPVSTKHGIVDFRKILRIMQILEERDEESFTNEQHQANHNERDFFGIKQENESQIIKKIGFEEHQPLQKMLFSQYAQQPIQFNSSEDLSKKIDFKALGKEETPVVKVEEGEVKIEDESCYNESRQHGQQIFKDRATHLNLRSLPRVSYIEQNEDSFLNENISGEEKNINYFKQVSDKSPDDELSHHLSEISSKMKSKKKRRKIKKAARKKIKKIICPSLSSLRTKGRKPENPEMEFQLIPWIYSSVQSGIKLTQSDIRNKARELTMKITKKTKFSASKGWIQKFFRRHPDIENLYSQQNKERSRQKGFKQKRSNNKREVRWFNISRLSPSNQKEKIIKKEKMLKFQALSTEKIIKQK